MAKVEQLEYECGTNREGIDPSPPLGWTRASFDERVVLYGNWNSPPCAKIRYHLAHSGVRYEVRTAAEFAKGKDPKKTYTKTPSLLVGDRQVNDSFVIAKFLVPALYAEPFDEAWEAKITYGLQLAIEIEAFEDARNWPAFLGMYGIRFPWLVASAAPCFVPLRKYAKSIAQRRARKDAQYGPLRSARQYCDEFRAALGTKAFFGGDGPSAVDVSFYGTIVPWSGIVPYADALVEASDLAAWWKRMQSAMPPAVVGDKRPPRA